MNPGEDSTEGREAQKDGEDAPSSLNKDVLAHPLLVRIVGPLVVVAVVAVATMTYKACTGPIRPPKKETCISAESYVLLSVPPTENESQFENVEKEMNHAMGVIIKGCDLNQKTVRIGLVEKVNSIITPSYTQDVKFGGEYECGSLRLENDDLATLYLRVEQSEIEPPLDPGEAPNPRETYSLSLKIHVYSDPFDSVLLPRDIKQTLNIDSILGPCQ